MGKQTIIYKSKVSKVLFLITVAAILLGPIMMLYHRTLEWSMIITSVLMAAICLPSLLNTHYKVEGHMLKIRSGFLYRKDIAIDSIRKIVETNNMISSPAVSLDRLEIFYNKFDSVLISPKDKAGFIALIQTINPNVEVRYKEKG